MSKYSCKCPVPGCGCGFEVEAEDWDTAFKKIYAEGNSHIIECHPDFPEPPTDYSWRANTQRNTLW